MFKTIKIIIFLMSIELFICLFLLIVLKPEEKLNDYDSLLPKDLTFKEIVEEKQEQTKKEDKKLIELIAEPVQTEIISFAPEEIKINKIEEEITVEEIENIEEENIVYFFENYHDLRIAKGSSYDELFVLLCKDIKTNLEVNFSMASVDLNEVGIYELIYYAGDNSYPIEVEVF